MVTTNSKTSPGTSNDQIVVAVVDDHPVIRDALRERFEAEADITFCGAAADADQAFSLIEKCNPDVLIIDLALRDAHGLDLLQNLEVHSDKLKIVVFSMYDEGIYAERAIRAGAHGYVMKSESTDKVVEAVRTVVEGEFFVSRRMISRLLGAIAHGRDASAGFPLEDLTDRELEVYQMLGSGVPIGEISKRLNISRKTVETYRRRVKEKLGLDSVSELLQHAIEWTHQQH